MTKEEDLKRELNFLSSQSKKALQISRKQANDYTVSSKIDGVVYDLMKEKGEIVGIQTPLAIIGSASHFVLQMQVDEYDITSVKEGMKVMITMDSYKGQVYEAKVTKIYPIMNERTKSFEVEAEFSSPPAKLYPNLTFEANIVTSTKDQALLIPRDYMLNDSMVITGDGKKVVVKTGLKDYQKVEILSGINSNDELLKPTK